MKQQQKKLLLNLALGTGVLFGLIMSMFIFNTSKDLKDYTRLEDGAGEVVQGESVGGVVISRSGRRASSVRYCTSYRHEINGNERFFTDRSDCHNNQGDAKSGTTAELIYDPSDLGITFIRSDETLNSLKGGQTGTRITSIIGIFVLIGSIVGLVVVNKPSNKKPVVS